jgi:hypothetical protein
MPASRYTENEEVTMTKDCNLFFYVSGITSEFDKSPPSPYRKEKLLPGFCHRITAS